MAKKRPPIMPRAEALRSGTREPVVIVGRCQIGEREAEDVLITDFSARGCRLRGNSIGVTKSEGVQLWLGEHGPVPAKLKWVKKGSLGLAFDAPIDDEVLAGLMAEPMAPIPSNVVPLRRRSAA